jgi:hypothetical protein
MLRAGGRAGSSATPIPIQYAPRKALAIGEPPCCWDPHHPSSISTKFNYSYSHHPTLKGRCTVPKHCTTFTTFTGVVATRRACRCRF